MSKTTIEDQDVSPPPEVPAEVPAEVQDEDPARRLLVLLLWILGIAAVGLLALLFWLLRPKGQPTPPGQAAGYPIQVVTTIYGFGNKANQSLKNPLGVAFDDVGNVWVSDTGQSRVEEYKSDGKFVQMLGADKGPGKLYSPYGIAVDTGSDRVYVADYGAGFVQIFSTSGQYIGHLPADDQNFKAFGANGFTPYAVKVVKGNVVVSSYDGLYFFDAAGHVVARWGGSTSGRFAYGPSVGMFNFPDAFTVDAKTGNFYIADTMNRRIVALDPKGNWLWVSGRPDVGGQIKGFWQLPRGIQLGPDGNLYVMDTFRTDDKGMGVGHIVVLSPSGQLLSEFGRNGAQDGAFTLPDQLTLSGDGSLWAVADRDNDRVVIFRLKTPYPPATAIEAPKYTGMLVQTDGLITSTPSP